MELTHLLVDTITGARIHTARANTGDVVAQGSTYIYSEILLPGMVIHLGPADPIQDDSENGM